MKSDAFISFVLLIVYLDNVYVLNEQYTYEYLYNYTV